MSPDVVMETTVLMNAVFVGLFLSALFSKQQTQVIVATYYTAAATWFLLGCFVPLAILLLIPNLWVWALMDVLGSCALFMITLVKLANARLKETSGTTGHAEAANK